MNNPSLNSAVRPVPHSDEIQISVFKDFPSSDIEKSAHDDANVFVDMGENDNDFMDYEQILCD